MLKPCCLDGSCIMLMLSIRKLHHAHVVQMEVASCSNLTVELFFKLMALSFLLKQCAVKLQLSYTWFETLLNNYKLGLFRNDIRIFPPFATTTTICVQ